MADTNDTPGSGVERLARKRRRYSGLILALAAGGAITGLLGSIGVSMTLSGAEGAGPKWLTGAAVALFMVGVLIGSWRYFTTVDELEIDANLWAGLIGLNFYFLLYLPWRVLSLVGVTAPVNGDLVALATSIVATVTFLIKRFR